MTINSTIYLDYASTTPVDPRVASKMMQFLTPDGEFGNPASRSHRYGWKADDAVEEARSHVANLVNCDPREIVWTSGLLKLIIWLSKVLQDSINQRVIILLLQK